jgi:DNA-binding PadR family transcriptional regulator
MGPRRSEEAVPLRQGEFLVLAALQRGPLHGYGISQAVRERTGNRVRLRPGNLYRVLDRMLERGLLELSERRPARDRDDQRRTYYRLTPQGRRALAEEAELLADVALEVISFSPAKA